MVPTAKRKMQSFMQKLETGPVINPHGPDSPPLQVVNHTAIAAHSPLLYRLDRQISAEAMKIPMPASKTSRPGDNAQPALGPSQAEELIERRDDGQRERHGWQSEPEEPHEEGGLRELWEEQSNINSLFSESEPTRPSSAQFPFYRGDDDNDASSDIVDNRQAPRRGRNAHRSAESAPVFEYQNGQLVVPSAQAKGLSTSMITHAPRNPRADAPRFRNNPFGSSSSAGSSPHPQREPSFLHSSFPVRGTEEIKRQPQIERPLHPRQVSQRISPEKYDGLYDAAQSKVHFQPAKEPSITVRRSMPFQGFESATRDWDADDSDIQSQGDEFPAQRQQHTPKASRQRVMPDDATVVLNPVKPAMPQKPQQAVAIEDRALPGSPILQASTWQENSPPKKRARDIDYDQDALRKMNFAELRNEPFDHDPARNVILSPAKPPADHLDERLDFYSNKDEVAQSQLFTQMSVREWEDSGDWFLERFGNLVTKMKEARQAKRKMVEQYEIEISDREEEVRRRKENIDRKLLKLKHDSNAMLKGSQSND